MVPKEIIQTNKSLHSLKDPFVIFGNISLYNISSHNISSIHTCFQSSISFLFKNIGCKNTISFLIEYNNVGSLQVGTFLSTIVASKTQVTISFLFSKHF